MTPKTFEEALRRAIPFLEEISDHIVISVLDETGSEPQPVSYIHGGIEQCETLTLALQFEIDNRKTEDEV